MLADILGRFHAFNRKHNSPTSLAMNAVNCFEVFSFSLRCLDKVFMDDTSPRILSDFTELRRMDLKINTSN